MNHERRKTSTQNKFKEELKEDKPKNLIENKKIIGQFIPHRKPRSKKVKLKYEFFKKFNISIFYFILFILPLGIISKEKYIKLTVDGEGYHQILSDQYSGINPSAIYVHDELQIMRDKKVFVEEKNSEIKIVWDEAINNFTYMFSNLATITSANMYYISNNNCNMSYMFFNCNKLTSFTFDSYFNNSYVIRDTIGMFYNCSSLLSFSFDNLFMDYYNYNSKCCNNNGQYYYEYYYYSRNMSYMFYNCQQLTNISSTYEIKNVSDMKYMFYNCYSLESIDLSNFWTTQENNGAHIDISYIFYNCSALSSFSLTNNNTQYFYTKDMNNMFYNCTLLNTISLNQIRSNSSYHINASRLFYNCHNLETFQLNFNNFFLSDMSEIFYNCTNLKYQDSEKFINIKVKSNNNVKINMSQIFYNCKALESITIFGDNSNYIYANDFHFMFYNCTSLTSIKFEFIYVHYAQNMSYMFYNCEALVSLNLQNIKQDSNLITKKRTMKGMFQNCESLISLDLSSNFYTKNVEIMWDMFKGCSKLTNLYINNFDTSQVTDMESMFEGCYNLISLDISGFNTNNVQYMNSMFCNCSSLKSLNFRGISSNSLGTMQHMFYNCSSLQYLNLFSLTEKDQSITEMFKGASTTFTFCIKENEDIPNIFQILLKNMTGQRDCSINNCYIGSYQRVSVKNKKLCCRDYEYKGNCYEKCPSRTIAKDNNRACDNFSCTYQNPYYNFEQSGCIEKIPKGYFINDTNLKTIDKCHEDCEECDKKEIDEYHTNCKSCKSNKPHIYLGNCYDKCLRGYYKNTESCKCFDERCSLCTEETILQGKCTECEKGYYRKKVDENAKSFSCYDKGLEKHYLKNNFWYQCYITCQTCNITGNEKSHKCITCDENNSFEFEKDGFINCYPNCTYYFYFNKKNNDKYTCTESLECPKEYNLKVPKIGQCVKSCLDNENYKYKFNDNCYSECPEDTVENGQEKFSCILSCPFDKPFMLLSKKTCVSNCTINERKIGECVTHYFGNRTNAEIQDKILNDIERDLMNEKFNYSKIDEKNIIIKEKNTTYELLTTNLKASGSETSTLNLAQCEEALRDFHSIPKDPSHPLYILKFDYYLEGKEGPNVEYRVYYPLEGPNAKLEPLDLVRCEGKAVIISLPANISGNPDLYNKNSPYYNDLCVSYDIEGGADMTLEDRQKEYIQNNRSLCEEDCNFEGYDKETGKVDCSCAVKFTLPLVSEIKIDKNKLYKFMDIKKIANFDVLKCWKLITSKVGIISNLGFYFFIPTFITYILCVILFFSKDYPYIKNQIKDVAYAKKYEKYIIEKVKKPKKKEPIKPKPKPKPKTKFAVPIFVEIAERLGDLMIKDNNRKNMEDDNTDNISENSKNTNKENNEILNEENNINNEKNEDNKINKKNLIDDDSKGDKINNPKDKQKINAPPIKETKGNATLSKKPFHQTEANLEKSDNPSSRNDLIKMGKTLNLNTINTDKKNMSFNDILSNDEREKIKAIMQRNDNELNILDYKNALKYDNRNYFQYYFSLLRTKHMIIRILAKNDYNSRIIKIYLAMFNFCLSFSVNSLFFNDDTMHKILEDGGEFNFIYQLPQIAYSAIISFIFENILNFLALSEENILSIKHEKIIRNVPKKAREVLKLLQMKFINFFIFSFIFLIGFWYYVTCFCAVYKNTQYHLIKDVLIGYGTSILIPLGLNLLPGLFRIPALKKRKEFLYVLSKVIQLI